MTPTEYNYRAPAEDAHQADIAPGSPVDLPGLSVFFRLDDVVYHTFSTYARGVEGLTDAYSLLDTTPYGRQQDWEDAPAGWPQRPTYG